MTSSRRVVVVGGGVAGLVAATWAAREGASVRLLEANSELGGRARTRDEAGFRFNMGPHALYAGSEGRRGLEALGVRLAATRTTASGALARCGGALHALPAGFLSLLTTGLLSLREKREMGRWLATLRTLDTARLDATPLAAALDGVLAGERSRLLARAIVRLTSYTHAPARQSAGAALRQLRDSTAGVLYLDGGWSQMVEALAERARDAGVQLRGAARARSVESTAERHTVVLRDGGEIEADAVVLAVGPAEASALVAAGTDPLLHEWAERATPVRAASLDVGLSQLPRPERRFCLGIDEPTYFSVHSIAPGLAPEGGAQIQVARYLAPDEKPERDILRTELEDLLDCVQPGWRAHVVAQKLSSELRVTQALVGAEQGGLGGRPAERLAHRPGLWIAGDWVGARGQLVDASFASGERAGRQAALGG